MASAAAHQQLALLDLGLYIASVTAPATFTTSLGLPMAKVDAPSPLARGDTVQNIGLPMASVASPSH